MQPSIFSYIKSEEARFETDEIKVGDNWNWSFRNHVQMIFHLKNGVFFTGANEWMRAFKNITEPILNLSYWMEDIELKDVVFYIEGEDNRVLSFLIKKYHDEVYVKENNLDTMFDEVTESDIDYGGALVQKTDKPKPEVLALNSIAFCDQEDILGGPIGFKFNFSPEKLRSMSKVGWGKESNGATITIEELITLATQEKSPTGTIAGKENKSTGKNIEVYIVRGDLPKHYLDDNNDMEKYLGQIQIVAYYTKKDNTKEGGTLYRKTEEEGNIKFHTSKKVHGRALGRGTGEAMLHPQIWSNFLTIHKMNMLEAASKVPLYTDDPTYSQKNKIQDMENLEITTIEDGKRIYQVPTAAPANIQLIDTSINEWYEVAQLGGSAFDPVLGKQAVSGTTFRGQNQVVQQGRGLHERRRGQRAKFFEEIYRDMIIPEMKRSILKGQKFLASLTADEMTWVSDRMATNYARDTRIESILNGEIPQEEVTLKQKFLSDFSKKGNKHLLEILKGEFNDAEIRMGINIAGKQKDLAGTSDKLLSIFQFIFANPQGFMSAMKIPALSKAFGDILEYSGLSISDFNSLINSEMPQAPQMSPEMQPSPVQPLLAQKTPA